MGGLVKHNPLAHLDVHRRLIVTRALASGMAGLFPVPMVDQWTMAAILRRAVLRLAEQRRVDITPEGVLALADGPRPPASLQELMHARSLGALGRQMLRSTIFFLALGRRANAVGENFALLTLFDHYCARMHVGAGLDRDSARKLRAIIDRTIGHSSAGLLTRFFRRALLLSAKTSVKTPLDLLESVMHGPLRRLFGRRDVIVEAVAEGDINDAVDKASRDPESFLARTSGAIEAQFNSVAGEYLGALIASFEPAVKDHLMP